MTTRARARRGLAGALIGLVILITVVLGLHIDRAAAQDSSSGDGDADDTTEEVVALAAELVAVERTGDLVELAITVPGAPPGELPDVDITTDDAVADVSVTSLDLAPTVVLIIDDSGSMAGARLEAAKNAAALCVAEMPSSAAVGLVAYSEGAPEIVEPSTDRARLLDAVDGLTAAGETATFDAVITSTELLAESARTIDERASRFLVLLTDGEDTVSERTADDAVAAMNAAGFRLFALGIEPDGEFFPTLEALTSGDDSTLVLGEPEDLAPLCSDVAEFIEGRYLVSATVDGSGGFGVGLGFSSGTAGVDVPGAGAGSDGDENAESAASNNGSNDADDGGEGSTSSGDDNADDEADAARNGAGEGNEDEAEPGALPGGSGSDGTTPPGADLITENGAGTNPGNGSRANGVGLGLIDGDGSVSEPAPEPSTVRLWAGAGAIAGAPLILLLLLVPGRRIRHGMRIRRPEPTGAITQLSMRVDNLLRGNRFSQKLERRLEVAQIKMRTGEFVTFTALGTLALALLLTVLGLRISAPAALVVIPGLAWMVVQRRARARTDEFQEQFGDTLMVLAGSLRAGNSTMQALTTASEKSKSPIAEELSRVVAESRIGRDVVTSLEDMAERMESEDARWVVEAIALNRELGGNLAITLENVAETMRARAEIASQVKVMSAEGRLTARILLALPLIVAVILQFVNPGYLGALFTSFGGNVVLGITISLMVIGAFWVSRIVKLEY